MRRHHYIICYDISNNRLRSRIERILSGYGVRVQLSVFECLLAKEQLRRLEASIREEYQNDSKRRRSDTIRFYPLCENCQAQVVAIGLDRTPHEFVKVI